MISLTNVSVVVAAEQHNPTILHPSFLQAESIVPDDWEVVEGPICTPAFSLVGFSNRIAFRAEQQMVQFIDGEPGNDGMDSPVPELARKYVEKLPHVHHKAVGINFVAFLEHDSSDEDMVERFLKKGPWNDDELKPLSLGVQLTYQITGATLNLSLKPGRLQKRDDDLAKAGIVLEGNCHSDIQSTQEVLVAIRGYRQKLTEACAIYMRVLEIGGEN